MKNKILSLLLIITLLAVTVSVALPASLADDGNLLANGDFSNYSGHTPEGWRVGLKNDTTAQMVQNVELPNGEKVNALKFTTNTANSSFNTFTYDGKVKIERNATYTMTYWVKIKNIKGFITYMFEPNYIDKDGQAKYSANAQEGGNIYSYSYDSGSTRVIRTDVRHTWKIAETGTEIDNSHVSMFISRSNNVNQVLTPDYPNTNRQNEWVQVIHTFSTGNSTAHEAEIAYDFMFPSAVDGELWIANLKMGVEKAPIDDYYTPAINNPALGAVSKDVACINGVEAAITAETFGENIFDGWFVDGNLVSTETTLEFVYDSNNPPKYEARFTKATFGVDGSFENGYTNGQLLAKAVTAIAPGKANSTWTPTEFLASEKNNCGIYIDSHNDGTWREAKITNEVAHTGKNSVLFAGQYGMVGYKYAGLSKNTEYILSVYAYLTADKSNDWAGVSTILVSPANESGIIKRSNNTYGPNNENALAYKYVRETLDATTGWTKYEIKVNTKDNTDVIFWLDSNGTNAKLYLDNFAISRPPQPFNPSVNDAGLGKATSQTTNVYAGAEVTVTAESVNGGVFKGWYIGSELVSTAATYTFKYEDKFNAITANFVEGPTTLPDYSFENRFTNGQLLAESPDVNYNNTNNSTLWTDDLFKTSSKDGNNKFFIDSDWAKWGKVLATTEQAHTGNFSIKMSPNSRSVGYKLEGLEKDTNYTVSFYAMTTGTSDSTTATVGGIAVTDANVSCIIKNPNGTLSQRTDANGALARTTGSSVDCRESWKKYSVRFNSKDSTDVIVWIRPEGADTKLYIDDLTLAYTPKEFKPASNNSSLGSVTPTEYVQCSVGQSVTVTATPYPDVEFVGWYVDDVLKSTDAEFTFAYDDSYQGLTAVFAGIPGTIPNGSFEYYQNGQILAEFNPNNTPKYKNNPPWSVIDIDRNVAYNLTVNNKIAHTGEKSAMINVPYRMTGLDIEGLQPGTEYLVSFWAYITGVDPTSPSHDQNPKNVSSAFVLPKGQAAIVEKTPGSFSNVDNSLKLGAIGAQVDCYNQWKKISFKFTTPEDSGDVTLWVNFSGYGAKLYLDDFSIGFGVKASISADLGGSVTSNIDSEFILKGTEVTAEATPFEGNTFTGWYTPQGGLVSTAAKYTFTANDNFEIIAKFDGYNKPAVDLFAMGGKDGTFENGTVPGWFFADPEWPTTWCSAAVSSKVVYEGKYSLEINGRYRNSLLALTGLAPNTDYRLSFYINQPDTHEKAKIESIAVIGSDSNHLGSANIIYAQTKPILSNTGWYKVDMYFNPGADTSANLIIRYSAETVSSPQDRLFIDNLSLVTYEAENEVLNGDLENGKFNWIGDGTVVSEGGNNVLSLGANEVAYQDYAAEAFSTYTVSFKAKGQLTAAALDILKQDVNVKNFISSVSYIDVDGTEWNEYSYEVYTGIQQAMNLAFASGANGAMIDDFKVTKKVGNAGSILEAIDFETERFGISSKNQAGPYSIYTATPGTKDPNVYSGNKSLKFTYNELLADTASIFDEGWLSYQTGVGNNFKISMKYKIADGKEGGVVNLAPEYSGTYGGETGFEHMANNDGWHTITFFINNLNYGSLKLKIASAIGATASDFYVDDIIISVAPPMVIEENTKITYCERLYNAVDNEGFENVVSAKDWKDLPTTANRTKGDALKGSYFLRANNGTDYVLAVDVKPNTEYYFGASIRGTNKTAGSIGITTDAEGSTYYSNRDEQPASLVKFDSSEKGWKRSGFKFTTDGSGKAYIRVNVTAGALDIDSVMLFTSDYGYRYDPNDYTVYVDYDYDNLKSATTVINGGFGEQPYYKGTDIDGDGVADDINPSTGDNRAMPVMFILIAVIASAVIMLITKRKEGTENA